MGISRNRLSWSLLFWTATLGPIIGLAGLYIVSWLIGLTGKWFGGQALPSDIRAALAWSSVPIIWLLVLRIPELIILAIFGPVVHIQNPILVFAFRSYSFIESLVWIWTFFVLLISLTKVHQVFYMESLW